MRTLFCHRTSNLVSLQALLQLARSFSRPKGVGCGDWRLVGRKLVAARGSATLLVGMRRLELPGDIAQTSVERNRCKKVFERSVSRIQASGERQFLHFHGPMLMLAFDAFVATK